MGESAAETVREIEEVRGRLEDGIRELEDRLPAPALMGKRLLGWLAGGGAGAATLMYVLRARRKRAKAKKAAKAARVAVEPAQVQLLPDAWADKVSGALAGDRWRSWAAAAGGLWVLLRLAEVRQLRRLNRTILSTKR